MYHVQGRTGTDSEAKGPYSNIIMDPTNQKSTNDQGVIPTAPQMKTRGRFRIIEDNETPRRAGAILREKPEAEQRHLRNVDQNRELYRQNEWKPGMTMPHGAWSVSPVGNVDIPQGQPNVSTAAGKSMSPAVLRILLEEARLNQDAYTDCRMFRAPQPRPRRRSPSVAPKKNKSSAMDGSLVRQMFSQLHSRSRITQSNRQAHDVNSSQPGDAQKGRGQMQ